MYFYSTGETIKTGKTRFYFWFFQQSKVLKIHVIFDYFFAMCQHCVCAWSRVLKAIELWMKQALRNEMMRQFI